MKGCLVRRILTGSAAGILLLGMASPAFPDKPETASTDGEGQMTLNLNEESLTLVRCPGGEFPAGVRDNRTERAESFWIGETEVTLKVWNEIFRWATEGTGGAPGEGSYRFRHSGSGRSGDHPVTGINWEEMLLWCNALTEYVNSLNPGEPALICSYNSASDPSLPYREYRGITGYRPDEETLPVFNRDADGFRLPLSAEWECAARYIDGSSWTPGNYVSGGTLPVPGEAEAGHSVSVFSENSSEAAPVASREPNQLGCYDMSGNVWERCYDAVSDGQYRIARGGAWYLDIRSLQVGVTGEYPPERTCRNTGFRIVRNL